MATPSPPRGSGNRALAVADRLTRQLDAQLADADAELAAGYPGPSGTRQPVHTVYVPADAAAADVCDVWGAAALSLLDQHAGDAASAGAATCLGDLVDDATYDAVRAKLARQPVEDVRLDLEDGYGHRPDEQEDRDAVAAAGTLATLSASATGPLLVGVRIKSLEAPTRRRALRSLCQLVAALADGSGLPERLVVTLPKVTSVDQVRAMVAACEALERTHRLGEGRLRFEIQVETPQAILGGDGRATVAPMLHAAAGRCAGLHYGTYDYSASMQVSAAQQSLEHPVADHAKAVMQVAAAGTGVPVSDGSTNVVPVGSRAEVHAAWALHAHLVTRSLGQGIYQGWDLHPGHLPTRYLATYAFFRGALPAAAARLRAYLAASGGGVMDEPATAKALAAAVLRAVDCGAVTAGEATRATGEPVARLAALARTGQR